MLANHLKSNIKLTFCATPVVDDRDGVAGALEVAGHRLGETGPVGVLHIVFPLCIHKYALWGVVYGFRLCTRMSAYLHAHSRTNIREPIFARAHTEPRKTTQIHVEACRYDESWHIFWAHTTGTHTHTHVSSRDTRKLGVDAQVCRRLCAHGNARLKCWGVLVRG